MVCLYVCLSLFIFLVIALFGEINVYILLHFVSCFLSHARNHVPFCFALFMSRHFQEWFGKKTRSLSLSVSLCVCRQHVYITVPAVWRSTVVRAGIVS